MRAAVCGRNSPSHLLQEMEKQRKAVQADWSQYASRAYNGAQDERRPDPFRLCLNLSLRLTRGPVAAESRVPDKLEPRPALSTTLGPWLPVEPQRS